MHRTSCAVFALSLTATALFAQNNVLLVMIDDLGPEYVGCYNRMPNPPATPVLDQLANTGIRFENAIADPVCTPSRVCLQTGRHAYRSNTVLTLWEHDPGLRDEELLLPEVLANSGYARGMVGKWHLGDRHGPATPNVQGWPFFSGAMYGGLSNYYSWPKVRNGVLTTSTTYATTDEVNEALAWINAQPQPWLMLLCLHAPHGVHHAPPANLHHQNLAGLDPNVTKVPFYKAMVEAADTELGRLLQGLSAQRANTNILVFGDNGTPGEVAQFGVAVERAKGSLYQTGLRIPFLANGPIVQRPGRVNVDDIHILDVFPTVLDLCGQNPAVVLPPNYTLDGRSLLPLLADQPRPTQPLYTENIGTGYGDGSEISGGGFKLIRFTDDRAVKAHEEMYQIGVDPFEAHDLLRQPLSPSLLWVYRQLSSAFWNLKHSGFGMVYGSGCPSSYGPVRFMTYQTPNIGQQVWMKLLTPTASPLPMPAVVVAGLSCEQSSQGPLPRSLGSTGMPGCNVLASVEWAMFAGFTDTFFWTRIPNDPYFVGMTFFMQGWIADPMANPAGLVTTEGYRIFIGR